MSHFTVWVVGDNVEEQLQPFHEFECTGEADQYVVDVDETEKLRASYKETTLDRLRAPDGTLHHPYDDQFYREPTPEEREKLGSHCLGSGYAAGICYTSRDWGDGKGYTLRVRYVPDGYAEVTLPAEEVQSFRAYCEDETGRNIVQYGDTPDLEGKHKYGHIQLDEQGEVVRVIDRTNPNAKWDWWVVGGRWTGTFKLKPGAEGHLGEAPRTFSQDGTEYVREKRAKGVDSCLWGDVDLEGMMAEARTKAEAAFDVWEAIFTEHGKPTSWDDVRSKHGEDYDAARVEYNAQPAVKALRNHDVWAEADRYGYDRAAYVQKCARQAITPYAILKDGVWYEKGKMGWWATVIGEKADWLDQAAKVLESIPPDVQITCVDCHI